MTAAIIKPDIMQRPERNIQLTASGALKHFLSIEGLSRTTFELAAKRLSADVLNINVSVSAVTKGETLLDTLRNLQAMQCDMFVVRHASSGAAHFIASHVEPHISVINALRRCSICLQSGATKEIFQS